LNSYLIESSLFLLNFRLTDLIFGDCNFLSHFWVYIPLFCETFK